MCEPALKNTFWFRGHFCQVSFFVVNDLPLFILWRSAVALKRADFFLQYKMLLVNQENVQDHVYSSDPMEWPLMTRGIAYWVSPTTNVG